MNTGSMTNTKISRKFDIKKILLFLGLALSACLNTPADSEAPSVPSGLTLVAGNGEITATWNNNTESDMQNYNLFWGTSATNVPNTISIAKSTNSKTVGSLVNGTTYFFAINSQDNTGNQSLKSATVQTMPVAPNPADTTAPTLVSNAPTNGTNNLPLTSIIRFTFSETMQPSSVVTSADFLSVLLTPVAIPLELGPASISNNGKTFSYAPSLAFSKKYSIRIDGTDVAGNAMTQQSITFSTEAEVGIPDTTPPTIIKTFPSDNATNLSTVNILSIEFSEEMKIAETVAAISDNANCTWGDASIMKKIQPQAITSRIFYCVSSLATDTTYSITVGAGAQDSAGNALPSPFSFKFSTINTVGKLSVDISGLPTNSGSHVIVKGPAGYSKALAKSQTLTGLTPGLYTITATEFTKGSGTNCNVYYSDTPSQTLAVVAGKTASVSVDFLADICQLR